MINFFPLSHGKYNLPRSIISYPPIILYAVKPEIVSAYLLSISRKVGNKKEGEMK